MGRHHAPGWEDHTGPLNSAETIRRTVREGAHVFETHTDLPVRVTRTVPAVVWDQPTAELFMADEL